MFTYLDLGRPHSSLFNIDKPFGNLIFSLLVWSISFWASTDWLDNVQVCPQKITGCEEGEVRPARIFYQFVIFLLFSCNQIWPLFYVWYSHANTPCKNILNIWSIYDCLCSHLIHQQERWEQLEHFLKLNFEHTYIQADLPNKIKNHPGWILQKGCESSSEGDPTNDYTQQSPWP